MNGQIISLISVWSVFLFLISFCFILIGINQSKKNKVFGILFLTISLNIIGTFIGCMIIYKNQHPEFYFWKSLGNKFKKMFKFKFKIKKRNKKIYEVINKVNKLLLARCNLKIILIIS